jgi:hypothetical protein
MINSWEQHPFSFISAAAYPASPARQKSSFRSLFNKPPWLEASVFGDISSESARADIIKELQRGRRQDLHKTQLPALHLHCPSARKRYAGD